MRYDKYKDSGFDWIGEIPEGWKLQSLKYCVSIKITDGPHETPTFLLDGVPFISAEAIQNGSINFNSKRGYISEEEDKRFSLKCKPIKDDIFIVKSGSTTGKIGYVHADINFNIWSPLALVRLKDNYYSHYMYHFFESESFQKQVQTSWSFGTQPNIGMNVLENLKVLSPSIKEQTAIANYLDRKTAQIDELIADKKRLLELYEEEKTAIINQAVTKGVPSKDGQPSVSFKDSGIDWLGEIPEHWEVKRVATFGSFSKGKGIPRSELKDDGFTAILYGDIYTKYDIKAEVIKNHINEETTKTSVAIEKGDLLFTGSGETAEDIGKCIAYLGEETVYVGGDVIILRQKKHNSLFLSYSLSSNSSIFQKASMAKGQIIIHIYASNLREIYLPIPPKEEQTAIVQYIETELNRINAKVEKTKKLIDLLGEYKQSLISEVVTGKIKVI